jgi:hypothetical protein
MKPATFLPLAFCLAFFLAATPYVVAQRYMPDTSFWENKAGMSQIRTYFPSVVASGRIYAFGGIIANAGGIFTYTDKIEKYDPDTDVWSAAGTLPQPMAAMAAVELDGAIYIIGGATNPTASSVNSKVYRYLPATGSFDADTIASLPAPRGFLSACAAGGKIYAIGGATAFFGTVHNEVYVYDPAVNNWTTLPNGLTIARAAFTSAVVGNKIYVIGGTVNWATGINSVEVYDFNNSHWVSNSVHLSNARAGHGSAVLSDIIYALGGIESTSSAEMSVEAFGPEIAGGDSWEVFNDLTYDRRAFGCVAWPTDGPYSYIYIMGGNSGTDAISSTQRLLVNTVEASEVSPASAEKVNTALSNFPNPFNQYTTLSYRVGKSVHIDISIFDAAGRLISTPVSGLQTPGEHRVSFDGAALETGLYFCVMKSEEGAVFVRKMVVMR